MHFSSSSEYHAWLQAATPNKYWRTGGYGETSAQLQEGINSLIQGSNNTQHIYDLVNQFQLEIETPHRTTRASVRGHRVNIGAYLTGSPLDMYQRSTELSNHTPLRVWFGTASSIYITADQITKRGAALAAFALSLANIRPVYLTPWAANGNNRANGAWISCDLQSSPIYLNELAAHVNVRIARYANMYATHCLSPHASGAFMPGERASEETLGRQILGCAPDDIWLPSIHATDLLVTNPVAWIKDNLAKYTQEEN